MRGSWSNHEFSTKLKRNDKIGKLFIRNCEISNKIFQSFKLQIKYYIL